MKAEAPTAARASEATPSLVPPPAKEAGAPAASSTQTIPAKARPREGDETSDPVMVRKAMRLESEPVWAEIAETMKMNSENLKDR